jgi:hypothetical protein
MVAQRTFSEFMEICEAKVPVTRQAGDFRYSGKTGEEKAERRANVLSKSEDPKKRRQANTIRSKIKTVADRDTARASSDARQKLYRGQQRRANDLAQQLMNKEENELGEKFSMAADTSKPQSAKATKLPRSRERNVGKHDDWKDKPTEWGERPDAGKKLRSRVSAVVGTQQRQDVETGVRKEETELDEVLMVTPAVKKPTKTVVKSVTKLEKPDPSDPDYVRKQREYVKSKQQEAIDYERLKSGAEAATDRAAAVKKAKLQRQQSDAESARTAFRTKGVPFSDAKGSGHIVNGKKVYAS